MNPQLHTYQKPFAAAALLLGVLAAPATTVAFPTVYCDVKPADYLGNNNITVSHPGPNYAGVNFNFYAQDEAYRGLYVVCPGQGTDVVTINDIIDPWDPRTRLIIVFGNGQKTIVWNYCDTHLEHRNFNNGSGASPYDNSALDDLNQFLVIKPSTTQNPLNNPALRLTVNGPSCGGRAVNIMCNTNVNYRSVDTGVDFASDAYGGTQVTFTTTAFTNRLTLCRP